MRWPFSSSVTCLAHVSLSAWLAKPGLLHLVSGMFCTLPSVWVMLCLICLLSTTLVLCLWISIHPSTICLSNIYHLSLILSVCFYSSVSKSCPALCDPMNRSTPGLPVHHQLPEFTQTHVHWLNDAIQPSHPLSSPSPPAFNLSQHQGLFKWISSLHRWPKYWSFTFIISLSNAYSGLIFFRIDLVDLLAVQGTLKSLLQHHSFKASILWCSAFFTVLLSHLYITFGKTISLTSWTFVSQVMSLLSNMLYRFVIVIIPRSKCLLILWLQSPSAVILEPKKIKSFTAFSTYLLSAYHQSTYLSAIYHSIYPSIYWGRFSLASVFTYINFKLFS